METEDSLSVRDRFGSIIEKTADEYAASIENGDNISMPTILEGILSAVIGKGEGILPFQGRQLCQRFLHEDTAAWDEKAQPEGAQGQELQGMDGGAPSSKMEE